MMQDSDLLNVYKTKEAAGSIVSFYDGADHMPMLSFVAEIMATQEGNPTPSAPIELTGYTGATVHVTGKNLANFNDVTGSAGATVTKIASLNGFKVKTSSNGNYRSARITDLHLKAGVKYTLSADVDIITNNNIRFGFRRRSNNNILISTGEIPSSGHYSVSYTPPYDDYAYLVFFVTYDAGGGGEAIFSNVQLQIGNETSFEAYNGDTYSIDWTSHGTIYGGSIDFYSGSLKARPYYASYNGETLVGPWLSSKDGYAESGTPTSGAEVVDFGGTETEYQLTGLDEILTVWRENNIWSSVGDSHLRYMSAQLGNQIDKLFIEGIDLQEKGWFLKWRKLSAPKPKTDYFSVFARDGDIDLTETEGQVFYEDRALSVDMVYIGNEWERDYSELLGLVHGQRLRVQFANDPSWYWSARLVAEIYEKKPHSLTMNGLAFPYKFEIVKTSASATVSGATEGTATTVSLKATRMPVSPKVTVTGTVTLKWGSTTKQLPAGTYYVDGLKVGKDGLSVKVWGTGTATFEYRRGAL